MFVSINVEPSQTFLHSPYSRVSCARHCPSGGHTTVNKQEISPTPTPYRIPHACLSVKTENEYEIKIGHIIISAMEKSEAHLG